VGPAGAIIDDVIFPYIAFFCWPADRFLDLRKHYAVMSGEDRKEFVEEPEFADVGASQNVRCLMQLACNPTLHLLQWPINHSHLK